MVNKVAFFDIDGTIYRDSLMVEHFRTLLDFDLMVSEKHATQAYKDWYKRQGDYEDYLEAVSRVYVEELKNLRLKFRGSSNQRIIDIRQSLKTGKIINISDYI